MQASTGHNKQPSADLPPELAAMDRDELSRLVREANDSGVSFQKMADRAVDTETGETLSKSHFQKMAAGTVAKAPLAAELRAMAAGLGRPLSVVQRAAAIQYMDYRATELSGYDEEVRIVVAHLAGMTPAERRRWRRMIEAADKSDEE